CFILLVFICMTKLSLTIYFFFFNSTASSAIYTLSLHDALPIFTSQDAHQALPVLLKTPAFDPCSKRFFLPCAGESPKIFFQLRRDRKSTRLNSSHDQISYAVFCLKKKKTRTYFEYAIRAALWML